MKRPKSAQLLSNYIQVYNPDEFRYHRLQIHNKMNIDRDGEEMKNPVLTEIINRGPSYLNTGNMLEPNISNIQKGKMKLEACKKLNIRQFIGVTRKIRQIKEQSQLIEDKLGTTQQIKVPNAKLMIAQINSSFNRSLRRSVKSRMIRSAKSYSQF